MEARAVRRIFLITLLLAVMSGCAARVNRVMASWQGQNFSDLIAAWGPPDQTFDDGAGGKILAWTRTRSYTTPGSATTQATGSATAIGNTAYGTATSRTTYTPPVTYSWRVYRMFWVNKDGVVYRWAWRGL